MSRSTWFDTTVAVFFALTIGVWSLVQWVGSWRTARPPHREQELIATEQTVPISQRKSRFVDFSEEDIDRALLELRSPHQRRTTAERLANAQPNRTRRDVGLALRPLLDDPDPFTRRAATDALGVWGTSDDVPALIEKLEDQDFWVRIAATDALAQLKDSRGAEALARRLPILQGRLQTRNALIAMGPVAEPYVAQLLTHRDWAVRVDCCRILEHVGTTQSTVALQQTADNDASPIVRRYAATALAEIERRTQ